MGPEDDRDLDDMGRSPDDRGGGRDDDRDPDDTGRDPDDRDLGDDKRPRRQQGRGAGT